MLRRLSVENYALIEQLELELDPHLNIITGETGAGKSILLGALSLLLGAKNEGSATKDATKSCKVEGLFDLSGLQLEPFFEENELDYETETTLTRIITPAGKSRSFINDVPVQLSLMRELGSRLVDIHSQHQNLILSSEEFRTSALDTVADNGALLADYTARYTALQEARRRLTALQQEAEAGRKNEEWLRFQSEELEAARLIAGEQAELEAELAILENADKIGELFTTLRNAFDEEQTGILSRLKEGEQGMLQIRDHYAPAADYAARLRSVLEELKDMNRSIAAESERIDTDPERLQTKTARLDLLLSLQQKHRCQNEEELIALRDRVRRELAAITHADEAITAAEEAVQEAQKATLEAATTLHNARQAAAPAFAKRIIETLRQLGMADTQFEVRLTDREPTPTGMDGVEFLFTANRTTSLQPIERIASGGELSRVMLSLKALLAESMQLPTILFDEIDTGVSGRIADAMGKIIARLSQQMQVVDITHLPQVASKGECHFVVYKSEGRTHLRRLTSEERTTEIAKMLSGAEITEAALSQARILLNKS
ncbi:MAG: DNA repair protein RecN [Alistipes sp.]|nr:DNA repair protein RecN [Alistipes sp.]